ncbi:twin-arginine translocase TatA/TatE family subunit [Streptomyces sp. NBC_01283]|nr:twin-arginine translocase TatA/TatE family subunit [Streptomyces sp. NBC_01283]
MLFGSKKLPDTARAVGKSRRILKSETRAMQENGERGKARPWPCGSGPGAPRSPATPPPAAARRARWHAAGTPPPWRPVSPR